MSRKTVEIEAVNAIDYNGQKIKPGETFRCAKDEADRLMDLGAACIPLPNAPSETSSKPAPLTVEALRANHPDLVEQIETEARQGYISSEDASRDFDALRKELAEAQEALEKAAPRKSPTP